MSNLVTVTRLDGIAVVALNNPPVNALSHAARVALSASFSELFTAADVEAIVIACEGRTFIAGADIREFGKPPLAPDLPELVELLDTSPKTTIAAIHGTALGGGLELSLACHFRVATESAKLGLPEVALGILPGAGGTQRLPRLIGVQPALDMIVSGTPVSATRAQRLGLIDAIIGDRVVESALAFARRVVSEGRPGRRVSELSAKLEDPDWLASYERDIEQHCPGFLAPFRCIEAVRAAATLPFAEGLRLERELFKTLIASAESKAQCHVFFGEREVAKVPWLPDGTPTKPLQSVAITGAGALAGGLARCFADARMAVTLLSDTQDQLDGTLSAVRAGYSNAVSRGRLTQAECGTRLERIRPTLSYDELRSADLLIEAVAEDLAAKRAALSRLDLVAKPGAILASSSRCLELEPLAEATGRPSDVVGLHFAEPIDESKLLEALCTPRTAPDTYATVMKLGRSLGKVAVPVHGQIATRLLAARYREALFLLDEGVLPEAIDRALTRFGFTNGPFTAVDPALIALRERHSKRRDLGRSQISAEEIEARCLYSVVNEAARVLDEGLATRPLDVDMVGVHGCGFPLYRGGPLFFADQVGLRHVLERISNYRQQLGAEYWTPSPSFERLIADGGSFYRGSR